MMDVHVSVLGNLVIVIPPITSHDLILPPPAVGPPFCPAVEPPVPVMWPPGFGLQQNKLTTTVVHKFMFIMLDGHDCGYMIPHVTIPPANLALPTIIAFSSRKVMFSSSTVKANGTSVGCSQLLMIPLPMMACGGPVSFPTAFPALNALNSVTVGMTGGDILAGIAAIVLSMMADALCFYLKKVDSMKFLFSNFFKGKFGDEVLGKIAESAIGKVLGGSNVGPFVVKTVFGALAGGAKILLTGEGSIKVSVGSAYKGTTFSYTRTHEGANQYSAQEQEVGLLGSHSTSVQHTSNPDGSTSDKTTETDGTPLLQHSQQTKTDSDPSGKTVKTTETDTTTGGAPLPGESGVAGTSQEQTVTKPGQAPHESSTHYGGVGTPVGGTQLWGPPL